MWMWVKKVDELLSTTGQCSPMHEVVNCDDTNTKHPMWMVYWGSNSKSCENPRTSSSCRQNNNFWLIRPSIVRNSTQIPHGSSYTLDKTNLLAVKNEGLSSVKSDWVLLQPRFQGLSCSRPPGAMRDPRNKIGCFAADRRCECVGQMCNWHLYK